MCAWQISEMHTFSRQHPKSIILSVGQTLEWKMLVKWLSCTGQSMEEKQVGEISETIFNHDAIPQLTSCPADPDGWMRPAIKSDGSKCYEYVLLYVDDALVVSENAECILRNELGGTLS